MHYHSKRDSGNRFKYNFGNFGQQYRTNIQKSELRSHVRKKHLPLAELEIIYELKQVGASLAEIGAELGLHPRSICDVARRPWVTAEAAIAEELGRHPMEIWPSRYDNKGRPVYRYRSARRDGIKAVEETLKISRLRF